MAGPIAGIATTAGVGAVGGIGAAGAEAGGVRAERPLVAGRALFPPAGVPVEETSAEEIRPSVELRREHRDGLVRQRRGHGV